MNAHEFSARVIKDRRKSMRTSAIVHIILILLALLPFMRPSIQPMDFKQAVLVEFEVGSSNEGSKMSAPNANTESSESQAEEAVEERKVMPETKPIERTNPPNVLTSETEPPVIKTSKVKKVEVKTTEPTESIPQKTEVEEVPTTPKDPVLKPTKVKKVTVKVEQPAETGSGSGNKDNSTDGQGKGDASKSGNGEGGQGSSKSGNGKTDGLGDGEKGSGKADKGNGPDGKGKGDFEGDGILRRVIIKYPDLKSIVKEAGKLSFNICVDRQGSVTFVEFNRQYSTIRNYDIIRKTLQGARDYKFEPDNDAPERECGRLTFNFKVDQ